MFDDKFIFALNFGFLELELFFKLGEVGLEEEDFLLVGEDGHGGEVVFGLEVIEFGLELLNFEC